MPKNRHIFRVDAAKAIKIAQQLEAITLVCSAFYISNINNWSEIGETLKIIF